MKNLLTFSIVLLVFIILSFPVFCEETEGLNPGDPAPKFVLPQIGGERVFLSDMCGEKLRQPWKNTVKYPVVISFFSSTCEPCKVEIPILEEIAKGYTDKVKFFLIGVGEPEEAVKACVEERGYSLPVLVDQFMMASKNYGDARKVPKLALIDKEGVVRMFHEGYKEENMEELKKLLGEVIK